VRAEGEHITLIKRQREKIQSKTSSFYEKRRLDFDPKVDNDSQITIHLTHVKLWEGQNFNEEKSLNKKINPNKKNVEELTYYHITSSTFYLYASHV